MVSIGLVVLLIQSVLYLAGFILIIVGIILILVSKVRFLKKGISTLIVIIVTIGSFLLGLYFRGETAFEKFYFSSKFSGHVKILYSDKYGLVPKKEGDWSLINIDTNHLLIIKSFNNRVLGWNKFYIVGDNGSITEIFKIKNIQEFTNSTCVLRGKSSHYNEFDVNILDLTLLRSLKDVPSPKENQRIDSIAYSRITELEGMKKNGKSR